MLILQKMLKYQQKGNETKRSNGGIDLALLSRPEQRPRQKDGGQKKVNIANHSLLVIMLRIADPTPLGVKCL